MSSAAGLANVTFLLDFMVVVSFPREGAAGLEAGAAEAGLPALVDRLTGAAVNPEVCVAVVAGFFAARVVLAVAVVPVRFSVRGAVGSARAFRFSGTLRVLANFAEAVAVGFAVVMVPSVALALARVMYRRS